MDVTFERTGQRRYAVVITEPGRHQRRMDPAPGYDEQIPHDLIHYLAEAELGLASGVFGRAAAGGGGGFVAAGETPGDPRRRRREQRRLAKREESLRKADDGDMAVSEHFAGLCLVAWKLRDGAVAERPVWAARKEISPEDQHRINRILDRLDEVAPLWQRLDVGDSITFTWPGSAPVKVTTRSAR